MRIIADQYEAALAQADTTRPPHQHRQRWKAYKQARRKHREIYREIQRQWARLYAAYHQLLREHQAAQQHEGYKEQATVTAAPEDWVQDHRPTVEPPLPIQAVKIQARLIKNRINSIHPQRCLSHWQAHLHFSRALSGLRILCPSA